MACSLSLRKDASCKLTATWVPQCLLTCEGAAHCPTFGKLACNCGPRHMLLLLSQQSIKHGPQESPCKTLCQVQVLCHCRTPQPRPCRAHVPSDALTELLLTPHACVVGHRRSTGQSLLMSACCSRPTPSSSSTTCCCAQQSCCSPLTPAQSECVREWCGRSVVLTVKLKHSPGSYDS